MRLEESVSFNSKLIQPKEKIMFIDPNSRPGGEGGGGGDGDGERYIVTVQIVAPIQDESQKPTHVLLVKKLVLISTDSCMNKVPLEHASVVIAQVLVITENKVKNSLVESFEKKERKSLKKGDEGYIRMVANILNGLFSTKDIQFSVEDISNN